MACGDCMNNYYKSTWKVCDKCNHGNIGYIEAVVRVMLITSFV